MDVPEYYRSLQDFYTLHKQINYFFVENTNKKTETALARPYNTSIII